MRRMSIFSLLVLVAACAGDDADSSGRERAAGGKEDSFDCLVVELLDDNVLEEGLGSIYDFDGDGFGGADSDSLRVSLEKSGLSKLKSKLILSIGQMSIGLH